MQTDIKEKLDKIREIYGSLYRMSKELNIPDTTVDSWYNSGKKPQAVVEPFLDLVIENHRLKLRISELKKK